MAGEVEPPNSLKEFFTTLYDGNSSISQIAKRFGDSSVADEMYACSGGKLLLGRHLPLGLTVTSITGSKNEVTSLVILRVMKTSDLLILE